MATKSEAVASASLAAPQPATVEAAGAGEVGRWLVPALALGATLAPLNSTMIAVALTDIQHDFNVSVTASAWLVTLYLVSMAVGQPIGGRLGDLYGRRRVYLLGLAWFGIASAGCAFAPNLALLIVFRTQQAVAGALSFPNGVAMIREGVPQERRGSAFGVLALATGLAAASGPPIGGVLVHHFGWASIFWANVPVVGLSLVLGWTSLPRHLVRRMQRAGFDIAGSALFAAALGAIILIPTMIKLKLPLAAVGVGAIGIAAFVVFTVWELRASAPVVDLRLFREPHFAASCVSICLSNLVMYTTLLALPIFLEQARGHDVQVSGLTLAALSAFSAIWGPIGGRWADRAGRWRPAVAGAVVLLAGTASLAGAVKGSSLIWVAVALALMGLGLGVAGAPVQLAAIEAAPGARTGSAAGLFSTSRYMGSVIGSSVLAIVFATRPHLGESNRFIMLFAALALIALIGIAANARIATRAPAA